MVKLQLSLGNGIAISIDNQKILLDPKVSDFISFVSHAHADHFPCNVIEKPYCTKETYELVKLRNPYFEANVVKENKQIKFDDFSVKLLSSGHILGATQTLIEVDGHSILYTGDFKLWQGLTSKPIDIQHADILITEATYGKPKFKFPSIEDIRKDIVDWVLSQIEKDYRINLGGYTVGKSQEIIKLLNEHGITPQVSETVRKYCRVYNKFDVGLEFLERGENSDVIIKPMHIVPSIKNRKVKGCVLTGWSLFRNYGVQGFPLSDHCDFDQLMNFIQQVNPKRVFCVHGYANQLAKEINKRLKIKSQTLLRREQRILIEF